MKIRFKVRISAGADPEDSEPMNLGIQIIRCKSPVNSSGVTFGFSTRHRDRVHNGEILRYKS